MLYDIKTFQQFDFPQIPKHLILSLNEIKKLKPLVLKRPDGSIYQVDWYSVYNCNQELTDWIKNNIPLECDLVEYIVSTQPIVMHKDLGRVQAFNYVIDTGGDNVVTEFYNEDRTTLLDQIVCKPNTWYGLNVSIPHRVAEPQPGTRLLISVTTRDAVTYYM